MGRGEGGDEPPEAVGEMREEYDFSAMKRGVRGKYAARMKGLVRIVVLDEDVASEFTSSTDVNEASGDPSRP